jgi:hypothetical protein
MKGVVCSFRHIKTTTKPGDTFGNTTKLQLIRVSKYAKAKKPKAEALANGGGKR